MSRRLDTPLPMRMRTLERDLRGYPIPFIVLRDTSGQPQFTINDVRRTQQCRSKRLCAICGKRFDDGMWFVGGSRCFLHPHGAFLDPPAHLECAEYALQVCPFLAMPRYSKRIDDGKLAPGTMPDGMRLVRTDHMPPNQPAQFGLGFTREYTVQHPRPGEVVYFVARWEYVEFWRNGERCNAPDTPEGPPIC